MELKLFFITIGLLFLFSITMTAQSIMPIQNQGFVLPKKLTLENDLDDPFYEYEYYSPAPMPMIDWPEAVPYEYQPVQFPEIYFARYADGHMEIIEDTKYTREESLAYLFEFLEIEYKRLYDEKKVKRHELPWIFRQ
jgi:hypothetical protein